MQALIDFDGWRKWKDFAEANGLKDPSKPAGYKPPVERPRKAEKKEEKEKKAALVPDPKTLDSKGLEGVGGGRNDGADTKDFAKDTLKGEELKKEDSPDTIVEAKK